jgi:hypothetical protein
MVLQEPLSAFLVLGGGAEPFTSAAAGPGRAATTLPATAKEAGSVVYSHCRRLASPARLLTAAGRWGLGESAAADAAKEPARAKRNVHTHGAMAERLGLSGCAEAMFFSETICP